MNIKEIVQHRRLVRGALRGDLSFVRATLAAGAPPDAPQGRLGRLLCPLPALCASCIVGALDIVKTLLAAGADVNDDRAGAPIEGAICGRSRNKPELVRVLLSRGARPSAGVRSAVFRGELELLAQLGAAGADLQLAFAPPVNISRLPLRSLRFLQEHATLPEEASARLSVEDK